MTKTSVLFLLLLMHAEAVAIVKYDEGNVVINGIQLFQDKEVSTDYYYLPQYPRIATKPDGTLEFLLIKYVGSGGPEANGGLFHALFEFALTQEEVNSLETALKRKIAGARIRGPVPMQEALKDGESGIASFKLISSVLTETDGNNPFTTSIVTSGHAPFLPGSRTAMAAHLSQQGATLLWETFQQGTSDVSVAIEGYFVAAVKGYNAVVEAEMDLLYHHLSQMQNLQGGFSRKQMRNIVDSLAQTQIIKINVLDQAAGLGIKTDDMLKILDLVTNQVIGLMFDTRNGWAKSPDQEKPADGLVKERYSQGGLSGLLLGSGSAVYIPDNQYILKERREIRSYKFYMNLSKSSTIKVPVFTAGNLRGLFDLDKEYGRYFRIVNMDDPDFQYREIHFQVDGNYAEGFNDVINFVTVNFRKQYGTDREGEVSDTSLIFSKSDVLTGIDMKSVYYPRLGVDGSSWMEFDYQVSWSIKGLDQPLFFPANKEDWVTSNLPSVSLVPNFKKKVLDIDADRMDFRTAEIRSATVRIFVILGGQASLQKSITLRVDDLINTNSTSIFYDEEEPVAYQVNWYAKSGEFEEEIKVLDGSYLFLVPPNADVFKR